MRKQCIILESGILVLDMAFLQFNAWKIELEIQGEAFVGGGFAVHKFLFKSNFNRREIFESWTSSSSGCGVPL